jgi:hypothetical protein
MRGCDQGLQDKRWPICRISMQVDGAERMLAPKMTTRLGEPEAQRARLRPVQPQGTAWISRA